MTLGGKQHCFQIVKMVTDAVHRTSAFFYRTFGVLASALLGRSKPNAEGPERWRVDDTEQRHVKHAIVREERCQKWDAYEPGVAKDEAEHKRTSLVTGKSRHLRQEEHEQRDCGIETRRQCQHREIAEHRLTRTAGYGGMEDEAWQEDSRDESGELWQETALDDTRFACHIAGSKNEKEDEHGMQHDVKYHSTSPLNVNNRSWQNGF